MAYEEKKRTVKKPKKITARYLDNAAAYYLGRYASSSANLKRILMRRAQKSCAFHETPLEDAEKLIDELVERYQTAGFLDDSRYAYNLILSLRNKGKSKRQILQKLYEKGVDASIYDKTMRQVDAEIKDDTEMDTEVLAAWKLAKRRRLGPFRKPEDDRKELWQKDLGSLARAGFSYDIASHILGQEDVPEEVEDALR